MQSCSKAGVSRCLVLLCALLLTLCSCESTPAHEPIKQAEPRAEVSAVRVRNFSLSKSFHKVVSEASRAIDSAISAAGGAITKAYAEASKESGVVGRTAMSSVVADAFRNAAGQVVDAANTVISYIPTSWPNELGPDAANSVVKAATSQINAAIDDLQHQAKVLKGLSAAEAESRINGFLAPRKVQMPKISIPGVGQVYVPLSAPLYVQIRASQWESSNSANLQVKLDFFGLKTYRIGFGCIGFPDGFSQPPRVALNGGCDNPWNLLANANLVAESAKKVTGQIGRAIESIGPQIMSTVRGLAGGANNPRNVPPIVLDLPINELLALCCSLSFPSSKAAEAEMSTASSVASDSLGNVGKDAALSFTVPELQGISFELSPDLSPVIFIGDTWTTAGQMEIGVQLGFFGLFVASVKMGCITFGESWAATPHFTFEGGCDKSWRVDFAAPGYTSAPHRMDARLTSGAAAGIAGPPPLPALPTVVPPGQMAAGGSITTYTGFYGYGQKYQIHTFTMDSDSEFVVTAAMEGVPIEYLIVAGGGSGASNKTSGKIGVGGGGGGGVLTNVGKQPIYLSAGSYTVVVGAGGTAPYREGNGLNGGNSSIGASGLVAIGGGGGGRIDDKANDGGSGGGAGYRLGAPLRGAGTGGQGFAGGRGRRAGKDDSNSAGGGGGGASGPGSDSPYDKVGGSGGTGVRSAITGKTIMVGGGGGGGSGAPAPGGASYGGGAGGYYTAETGIDGAANTGGGGGGAASRENKEYKGGNGGSGLVIISYPVSK